MYSGYSPVSSEGPHSVESATQMDFDEKAERILVSRSIHFNDDSSSWKSMDHSGTSKKLQDEKYSQSCTTTMCLPEEPLNLCSSSVTDVTSQYSNSKCSADQEYELGDVSNSTGVVSMDVSQDQGDATTDLITLNRISDFDVTEAAKRLFIATSNSPTKKAKPKQEKRKHTGSKEKSENVLRIHANYQRHPKPPYPYTGMIIHAIDSSTEKALTLTGIINKLKGMFDFFKGSYTGWKDSVRHNLSHNACFVKGERCRQVDSKGNLWHVDISRAPINCFKLQDTPVAREGHWAQDLHVQLGLPEIHIPSKKPQNVSTAKECLWTVHNVVDDPPSVFSEDMYSNYSPESDSSFAVPLSVTPASTTSEECPTGPYHESFTESREVPAFLSDTSFEDRTPGPIKTEKGSRQNRRYNPAWNKRNNTDVMKTIARKAAKNVCDKTEAQNLLPLCPSPQYPQVQDYHYPQNPYYRYQHQYITEPSFHFPALQSSTGYEYPPAYLPYPYQSFVAQYPSYPMSYDVQAQNYLGHPHHFYQSMDYSPYMNFGSSSSQYQQHTSEDTEIVGITKKPVDFSLTEDQNEAATTKSEADS